MQFPPEKIEEYFYQILGSRFDKEKFYKDIKAGKKIQLHEIKKYKKQTKDQESHQKSIQNENIYTDNNQDDENGLRFYAKFEDGKYVALSSDGQEIEATDIDELHKQLASSFKLDAQQKGKSPQAFFHCGSDDPSTKQKEMESFATIFIMEGVAVGGDIPENPEFWKNLKQMFLADKKNTLEQWFLLTRYVPLEYLGEDEEELEDELEEDEIEDEELLKLRKRKINPRLLRYKLKGKLQR